MINGPPRVVPLAIDFHEHLVEVPAPAAGFHSGYAAFFDLSREEQPEPMPPVPNGFMTDIDAALVGQVIDVS
ncbi:MAG: hypothetical protein RID96_00380 [Nitratireductor sp.]